MCYGAVTLYFLSVYTLSLCVCLPIIVPPGNPIIEARDEVLSEGNETEMTCSAMSSKPAATIRWMKGDKELPGRRSTVLTCRENSSSVKKFPLLTQWIPQIFTSVYIELFQKLRFT